MAKHSFKRRSNGKNKSRKQSGGDLAGNPPSAWGWTLGTVGNGWQQFMDSLTIQPGQGISDANNNDIVPIKNLKAQSGMRLNAFNPRANMRGGKMRKHKKGGSFGAVISQAAVPVVLLAAQQSYKPNRTAYNMKNKTRRYRR
jgi:hypothetical protein